MSATLEAESIVQRLREQAIAITLEKDTDNAKLFGQLCECFGSHEGGAQWAIPANLFFRLLNQIPFIDIHPYFY
jgi:hypothetical protein